jgi:hypothetical protein
MIIRSIDSTGDWVYGKGKNDYKRDKASLIQDLNTRLKEWKYDCFFAQLEGVDYKNFLDRGTQLFLDADIKKVILKTEGILRIDTFSSTIDKDTRLYTFQAQVFSIYGNLEVDFIQPEKA